MGLFDNLTQKEERQELERERRHKNINNENATVSNSSDALTDQSYRIEQDNKSDLIKWQQDLDDDLNDLVMTLKGRAIVNDTIIQVAEPLCNDLFIHQVVIPQCKPFLSRNMINSKFDEKRLLNKLKHTMNDIADAMADSWGIKGSIYNIEFVNFNLIDRNIKNVIEASAFRSLQGWTKKTDSTMIRRNEVTTESIDTQKKSMFGLAKT